MSALAGETHFCSVLPALRGCCSFGVLPLWLPAPACVVATSLPFPDGEMCLGSTAASSGDPRLRLVALSSDGSGEVSFCFFLLGSASLPDFRKVLPLPFVGAAVEASPADSASESEAESTKPVPGTLSSVQPEGRWTQ
jgi:hypothetical protein